MKADEIQQQVMLYSMLSGSHEMAVLFQKTAECEVDRNYAMRYCVALEVKLIALRAALRVKGFML